jgi:hypothetical protein
VRLVQVRFSCRKTVPGDEGVRLFAEARCTGTGEGKLDMRTSSIVFFFDLPLPFPLLPFLTF